jgi:hypothetical protein
VGFVVGKMALGQDLSKYFGFPCQIFTPTAQNSSLFIIRFW